MSGSSYTVRNQTSARTASPSSAGSTAASVGGSLLVEAAAGAVALTAAAAGLAAYGLYKGIGLLAKTGVRAYRAHKRRQEESRARSREIEEMAQQAAQQWAENRIRQARSEQHSAGIPQRPAVKQTAAIIAEMKQMTAEQHTVQQKLEQKQLAAFENMRDTLMQQVSGQKVAQFRSDVIQQKEALFRSWKQDSDALERECALALGKKQAALLKNLTDAYSDMRNRIQLLDPAHQAEKMKELSETAVSDAGQVLAALTELPGTAVFAQQKTDLLYAAYKRCCGAYQNGMYESAYSQAEDIMLQAEEIAADVMQQQFRSQTECSRLTARAAMLDETINGISAVSFVHKGVTYQEDLTRFCPESFRAAQEAMKRFWARMHSDFPMTEDELRTAEETLDSIERSYHSMYETAWRRMASSYYTADYAETICAVLESQDYELAGNAYEGDQEGTALHINFVNAVTQKRITVVADSDEKGNPDIRLEQFGAPGEQPDRAKQQALCNLVSQAIGAKMVCASPGQHSQNHAAADLTMQKRAQITAP